MCEGPERLPSVLTFVFSREHIVKRESHRVDLAGELEAPLLTLAAQGLQGHQQVTAGVCREKMGRPRLTALLNTAPLSPRPLHVACYVDLLQGSARRVPLKLNMQPLFLKSALLAGHQCPTGKPPMI